MSTITKFTPGPWMAAAKPSSVVGWPVVGGMGRSIANVTWLPKDAASVLGGSDAEYEAFNQQCRANADLIAAAPELYEALVKARAEIATNRAVIFDCHTVAGNEATLDDDARSALVVMDGLLGRIDGALAKARGEA